ncbi:hypothetical protein GYMLUDRAFT_39481 [Collybiopsis luxurians FD-317 M1]|nr:hypothetical protein GYMLUDRAFT_39481 [Collybiopsis luxurians FD-317 M1]
MNRSQTTAPSPLLTVFRSFPAPSSSIPYIDYRSTSRIHFDELSRFLAACPTKTSPSYRSKARRSLTRLTIAQFHELSTDVHDECTRRKSRDIVPFLFAREEFHPKRNQARQKLATFETSRFEDLASDVHFELSRRYPEFKEDPNGRTSAGSNYDDDPAPGYLSSTPRTYGRVWDDHWPSKGFRDYVKYGEKPPQDKNQRLEETRDYGHRSSAASSLNATNEINTVSEVEIHYPTAGTGLSPATPVPWMPAITNQPLARLQDETFPPTGHLALVFTNIWDFTHLWEVNQAMGVALEMYNATLRRNIGICGGYEVKTRGDGFMCAFPTTMAAVWWSLVVQIELLEQDWPLEILQGKEGKPVYGPNNQLITRGLSVNMGIHCGVPLCEIDSVTQQMDYFGPMVNRCAQISCSATRGQILCSQEVICEIKAKLYNGLPTPYSDFQLSAAVENVRQLGVSIFEIGGVNVKGLEIPQDLHVIYPSQLDGRHSLYKMTQPSEVISTDSDQKSINHIDSMSLTHNSSLVLPIMQKILLWNKDPSSSAENLTWMQGLLALIDKTILQELADLIQSMSAL